MNIDGISDFVLDVVNSHSLATGLFHDGDGTRLGEPARRPGEPAVFVGKAWDDGDDLQLWLLTQSLGQQERYFDGPKILVFDVDQGARPRNRLSERTRDTSFAIGRERVLGTPRWIGPKYLDYVSSLCRRAAQTRWERSRDTIARRHAHEYRPKSARVI